MATDEINTKIKEKLREIFPNPQVASAVVDIVVHNKRPKGWSKRSHAPYYKEIFARQIQSEIDRMIETKQDVVYRYATFCGDETGMSKDTLYQRVNQSIRYLVECLDTPDRKYDKWYQTVRIQRPPQLGVTIKFIPGLSGDSLKGFTADAIRPDEEGPVWKRQLDEWLESDNTTPFHKDKLALTSDQIKQLTQEMAQLSNVMASITSSTVKIIKIA